MVNKALNLKLLSMERVVSDVSLNPPLGATGTSLGPVVCVANKSLRQTPAPLRLNP
jgi:hypothetical protein